MRQNNRGKNTLSVIIPTFNSEIYLDKLLTAISGWPDEIIVCDSFSTDSTLEIARRHSVKILEHEYINSAKQKNWAIPQAQSEWVMIIDSDELPEPELMQEISNFLSEVEDEVELVHIPRKNLFWGRLMGQGVNYPDYQSRLFRRDKGRYNDREVHAQVNVSGKKAVMRNALVHDDFTDISSWWLRNNRYFRYELDECTKHGKRWSFKLQYIKPIYVFFQFYIGRGTWRYGFPGLFAAMQWFIYYFMVGAKLYESELSKYRKITHKSANSN